METVISYIESVLPERKMAFINLRNCILENLPNGFEEQIIYGMIGYVVPHRIYPNGYHCNPKLPLPFISIASQKNALTLYHLGIYADSSLLNWFKEEYENRYKSKIDMGKSCLRFKNIDKIPFDLIAELAKKVSVEEWITTYELNIKKK